MSGRSQTKAQGIGRRTLSAVSKALSIFIIVLSILWAGSAVSILQEMLQETQKVASAVPAPVLLQDIETMLNPEPVPPAPAQTKSEKMDSFKRLQALDDPLGRIHPDFRVPKSLKRRTTFWFNVYTKYGKYEHIIHHTRYPWIIYKIIDGRSIIRNKKGPLWRRRQRLEKKVQAERIKIRKALARLSKRKSFKKMSSLERNLYKKLKYVRGKRKTVFKTASNMLRSQLGQKDFFVRGLKNSSRYLPHMESYFESQGLPAELTRIPFVESSFNVKAHSKVGASGVWQIMPRTGKAYMRVSKYIDERNSPLKATEVAAKVLRTNYRGLKSWPLAVTAYNNGIGNIRKAIRSSKSRNLGTILNRYHRGAFRFASSNFYVSFLAALHAEKYHDVIFSPMAKDPELDVEEIRLTKKVRARSLLSKLKLSTEDFVTLNLDVKKAVRKNTFLPKGLRLLLPPEEAKFFRKKFSRAKSATKTESI